MQKRNAFFFKIQQAKKRRNLLILRCFKNFNDNVKLFNYFEVTRKQFKLDVI